MRGRPSELPPQGWTSSVDEFENSALSAVLHLEDAHAFPFDLSKAIGPDAMRAQLVAAVVAHSAAEDGWRRVGTVESGRRGISSWLRWVVAYNTKYPQSTIESLAQVTRFHVRSFYQYLFAPPTEEWTAGLSETTAFSYVRWIRSLLPRSPELAIEARTELRKRLGDLPAKAKVQRYSTNEFNAIKNAARRALVKASDRIRASMARLTSGDPADAEAAKALREIIFLGSPASPMGYEALGISAHWGYYSATKARRLLFLDTDELLAAAVLIASKRGLNLSSVTNAEIPFQHEEGIAQVAVDKPRRGPTLRFWPEIVVDDPGDLEPGDASLLVLIGEATQPARDHLSAVGRPTERLLVKWSHQAHRPSIGLATERTASWLPKGVSVDFRRLRRSVPGAGVAKEPTNHDTDTYLHYVRTDPAALAEQQAAAADGIRRALDRARGELHLKLLANADAREENDALIANCADPERHPDTMEPCTSGFYSFLLCLGCGNAATVARLLPAQLATIRVLDGLRDSAGDQWETRFARSFYTLSAMVERHTKTELADAEASVGAHIPRVLAALRLQVPV